MQSRERKAWSAMKYRCSSKNRKGSENYVGRGIKVAPEWVNNVDLFISEIGMIPDDRRWSVERIDLAGDYEPGNVKWALPVSQNRNRNKFRNNTSGKTGVISRTRNGNTRWIARWYGLDGRSLSKSFLESKYEDAYSQAVSFRDAKIQELISLGADYTEKHGG